MEIHPERGENNQHQKMTGIIVAVETLTAPVGRNIRIRAALVPFLRMILDKMGKTEKNARRGEIVVGGLTPLIGHAVR